MILSQEHKMQVLKDLDNIYNALCAEEMSGSFRTFYIMKQVEDMRWLIDPKGKGKKRYARYQRRLRNLK